VVRIQPIMPGTHSGDHAWYILARSMTLPTGKNPQMRADLVVGQPGG
jgi:hypothetical protein